MRRLLPFTGVMAVTTLWGVLLIASSVADFDIVGSEPVSYLGTRPASTALFTVALGVSALLFSAFHFYVRDRFAVGSGFSVAMLTGMAGQMVAAFVSIGGDGVAHRVHTYSALVLGASLPVLMWRFAAAQPLGRWRRLCYRLFWAEAAACAVGLYLSSRSVAPLAEILPAVVFHGWVITVTIRAGAALLTRNGTGPRQLQEPLSGRGTTPETRDHSPTGGFER